MLIDEFTDTANRACSQHDGHVPIVVTGVVPSAHGPLVQWTGGSPATRWDRRIVKTAPLSQEICGVLARVLACRWREGRAVIPKSWREDLAARHPNTFEPGGPHSWGGWRWLWEAGAELVAETGVAGFKTEQTKEKFAQARWYWSSKGTIEQQQATILVVDCIEHLSAFTCEYCGSPGSLRSGGWAKTCCDYHAIKANQGNPR